MCCLQISQVMCSCVPEQCDKCYSIEQWIIFSGNKYFNRRWETFVFVMVFLHGEGYTRPFFSHAWERWLHFWIHDLNERNLCTLPRNSCTRAVKPLTCPTSQLERLYHIWRVYDAYVGDLPTRTILGVNTFYARRMRNMPLLTCQRVVCHLQASFTPNLC